MSLLTKPAFAAFKAFLVALTFPTSMDVVFASVFFTTGEDTTPNLWPKAAITITSTRAHSEHVNRTAFFEMSVEIRQPIILQDTREGAILDLNRTTDEATGAGLADLQGMLMSNTRLLNKNTNAAIRPWIRCTGAGEMGETGTYTFTSVNYEAHLEIASA